jgi:hypothetical protein
MTHPADKVKKAARLFTQSLSDYEISRRIDVPRSTINSWRHRPASPPPSSRLEVSNWRPPDEAAYAYLLGVYLGDGHISVVKGSPPRLGLYMDARFERIVEEVRTALISVVPGVSVRMNRRGKSHCVLLVASHPAWIAAFPQHGSGRKHMRKIELTSWQRELTSHHPKELLRGLIHSDGSRVINRFRVSLPSGRVGDYAYTRYFFSNLSSDIRRIFCEHCEMLGIRWTQSNQRNISVSHRDSVAILDSFVGPKR